MDIIAQRSDWPRLLQPMASRRAPRPSLRRLPALAFSALALSLLALPAAAQNRGRFTLGVQGTTVWAPMTSFTFNNLFTTTESCRCAYFGWGLRLTARVLGPLGLDAEWGGAPAWSSRNRGVSPSVSALLFLPALLPARISRWMAADRWSWMRRAIGWSASTWATSGRAPGRP